jgi:hypothetical protein
LRRFEILDHRPVLLMDELRVELRERPQHLGLLHRAEVVHARHEEVLLLQRHVLRIEVGQLMEILFHRPQRGLVPLHAAALVEQQPADQLSREHVLLRQRIHRPAMFLGQRLRRQRAEENVLLFPVVAAISVHPEEADQGDEPFRIRLAALMEPKDLLRQDRNHARDQTMLLDQQVCRDHSRLLPGHSLAAVDYGAPRRACQPAR